MSPTPSMPRSTTSRSIPSRRGTAISRLIKPVAAALVALLLSGCFILSLEGPTLVAIGQLARYTLELETNGGNISDLTVYVIADVPEDWTLESSAYAGMADGQSYDGMGSADLPPGICNLPQIAPGYQRVTLSAGPFPLVQLEDTGVAELEFQVGGPEGEYLLSFWTAGVGNEGSDCDTKPETLTVEQIEGLFFDDFETGDTSLWSATSP